MAMASSSTSDDIHVEDEIHLKTEMKFEQGGVSQKFFVNGNRRNETVLIPGKLFITENRFGDYLEWKPNDATPNTSGSTSPYTVGFPEIHGTGGGIGFRPGKDDVSESLEFLPDPREAEYRRPVKLELSELQSFLVTPKAAKREIIFNHSDGSILNAFVFERGSPENFVMALERSVTITKSKHHKNMFIVGPKREPPPNIPGFPIVAELFPDQVNQMNHLWGFAKEFKNDPYATSCTLLAKINNMALNGELPTLFPPQERNGDAREADMVLRNGRSDDNNSSFASDGMEADYTTNEEGYEVIFKPERPGFDLPPRPETYRGQPLSQEQWLNYLDNEGRLINMNEIRKVVFHGGVEPTIRVHVWPLLLGVYEIDSSYEERKNQYAEKLVSYNRIKTQWVTISEDQEERFHLFRDYKSLIEKDVNRTDRTLDFFKGDNCKGCDTLRNILMTYVMYNFNLGYVQGMSDIVAPILIEIQDEILAFWLFVKFMDKIHTNFEMSQESMQKQLRDSYSLLQLVDPRFSAYLDACDASNMYFGFRWLLIWFKREFSFPEVLILWESLWTGLPGPNFQLFIGLAILVQHRISIMENKFGLSEILRHVNDLSMRIDLEKTLSIAEGMYLQVLQVQDKLANNIRTILGLSEIEEKKTTASEEADLSLSTGSIELPAPDRTSSQLVPSSSERGGSESLRDDAVHLENQYELGVSQFM